jgi:hypothetical protein
VNSFILYGQSSRAAHILHWNKQFNTETGIQKLFIMEEGREEAELAMWYSLTHNIHSLAKNHWAFKNLC